MNNRELKFYQQQVSRYKQVNFSSSDDVKRIILRDFSYKKMQLVNPHLLDMLDTGETEQAEHQIYVFAEFFKPGKGVYVCCTLDDDKDLQFFTHKIVNRKREE